MTPAMTAKIETMFRQGMITEYGAGFHLCYANVPVPDEVPEFGVVHIIVSDDPFQMNIGPTSFTRVAGLIQIDIFTPLETGAGRGKRICHYAAKMYHRKKIFVDEDPGVITFREAVVETRGEHRGRHKEMASIGFRYDFDQNS